MSLNVKFFSPIWSHVDENGKIRKKSKIKNFENTKLFGDMVDRYLSPKFSVNSLSGIRENDVYRRRTDGRRMDDDERPHNDSTSAVQ